MDGLDFVIYLPLTYLLSMGAKELNINKHSWIFNLGLIILMTIEIGRIFL